MYQFAISDNRIIESANFCFFDTPYIHPSRNMIVHDFIYMLDGEWKIGLKNKVFEMHNDDVLILPANQYHYGIAPCAPQTRTMYFHVFSVDADGASEEFSRGILTNEEIAVHFNISKRTAEILFKKYYDTTIHEFVLNNKLQESKQYLLDFPDMKIFSIAKALGFYDEFHFSKMFSRKFGISPSAYRKQNFINTP